MDIKFEAGFSPLISLCMSHINNPRLAVSKRKECCNFFARSVRKYGVITSKYLFVPMKYLSWNDSVQAILF